MNRKIVELGMSAVRARSEHIERVGEAIAEAIDAADADGSDKEAAVRYVARLGGVKITHIVGDRRFVSIE